MNKTQLRIKRVLERIMDGVDEDEDVAEIIADALDSMLEDLAQDDFFGSERALDPRGDGRNGSFSMRHVEGVDT